MFNHAFNIFLTMIVLVIIYFTLTIEERDEFAQAGKFVSSSIVDAGFFTKSLVTTSTGTYIVEGGFSGEYGNEIKIKKVVQTFSTKFIKPLERMYICNTVSKMDKEYCRKIVD